MFSSTQKYNSFSEIHITFKQPCFVSEKDVKDIKQKLSDFSKNYKSSIAQIDVVFNKLLVE